MTFQRDFRGPQGVSEDAGGLRGVSIGLMCIFWGLKGIYGGLRRFQEYQEVSDAFLRVSRDSSVF